MQPCPGVEGVNRGLSTIATPLDLWEDALGVSAAQVMRRHYTRLFEAAVFENGLPNPRHLSNDEYLALARRAAPRGARRNGVAPRHVSVSFPLPGSRPPA